MAKHRIDGKGSVSKGIRRSSVGLKKVSPFFGPVVETGQRNSALREAFDNILIKHIKPHCKGLVENVSSSLNRKVGLIRVNAWNAHLSHRMAEKLNAKGGWDFKNQPRTAYDNMLVAD